MAKQNKTSETSKTKQVKLKKTKVAQQLYEIKKLSSGAETSLRPCGWNCSLEFVSVFAQALLRKAFHTLQKKSAQRELQAMIGTANANGRFIMVT